MGGLSVTLSPSAHLDAFCRDHLPPPEQWPEFLLDLPDVRYPERLNVATVLLDDAIAAGWGERPCLVTATGESWTYADLLAKANQVARVLTEDLALVPGNRVLLRGPNNPWLVAAWFGVLKAGGVVVPTMPLLRAREPHDDWRGRPVQHRHLRCPLPRRARAGRPARTHDHPVWR